MNETPAEAASGSADPDAAEAALSRELKRLVGTSGKPLRQLGDEVNASASTLSRVTSGKLFPSLQLVTAIAAKTGGDPEYVAQLWADADDERRAGSQALPDVDLDGDERELLRVTAAALDAERQRRHLSLGKLAKKAGYGKSTLSELFRGESVPGKLKLHDVLQAMGLSDTEIRAWTARFARAAERARKSDSTRPQVDIAAALAPLQARLHRHAVALAVVGVFAVAALALGWLAFWVADGSSAVPDHPAYATTTVTAGTPLPPGPKTATVDLGGRGEVVSVFEQPRADAAVSSTLSSSTRIVMVCQADTAAVVKDAGLTYPTGRDTETTIWVKISLGGKNLGFVPSIYLLQDTDQRPVLPPPAC
ncbi:helix-turn-helix domain-containing protein [Amycolatopsis sp. MEPSY49]|uniref:helix-turn-helix domain-containing protein n=1 Tax=Amycolatopsis sp. MEPSY49 TaxID=3151600 RepID=UPI003EF8405D